MYNYEQNSQSLYINRNDELEPIVGEVGVSPGTKFLRDAITPIATLASGGPGVARWRSATSRCDFVRTPSIMYKIVHDCSYLYINIIVRGTKITQNENHYIKNKFHIVQHRRTLRRLVCFSGNIKVRFSRNFQR